MDREGLVVNFSARGLQPGPAVRGGVCVGGGLQPGPARAWGGGCHAARRAGGMLPCALKKQRVGGSGLWVGTALTCSLCSARLHFEVRCAVADDPPPQAICIIWPL